MAIPEEVQKTFLLINSKIAELKRAKATLEEAFGVADDSPTKADSRQMIIPVARGMTRRETLRQFLMTKGPSTKGQITQGLPEFPDGTLGFLLNEKQGFKRSEDGLWDVIREGIQEN